MKGVVVAVMSAGVLVLSGCLSTPAYHGANVSATDGSHGVTIEGFYSCAYLDEKGEDAFRKDMLEKATQRAGSYCERFGKEPDGISIAITRRCSRDDNWNNVPGQDGGWRALFVCEGADEVRIVDGGGRHNGEEREEVQAYQ